MPEELERQRRILAYNYESEQAKLYEATENDAVEETHASLAEIRQRQQQLQRDIREHAPRLADLQYPQPVNVDQARGLVTPGTHIVSYSVGPDTTHAFLLGHDGDLVVRTLPVGRAQLDNLVTRYRLLMDAGRISTQPGEALIELGETLYGAVLQPLESEIGNAERLLIVPDGPLNVLPFASLVRSGSREYVAEWKPHLTINSLTVYSQLRPEKLKPVNVSLIAFGNPQLEDAQDASGSAVRSRGVRASLSELPWSLEEVENIGNVYEARATVYTGTEATEERAKAETEESRYVHFATHAVLNEVLPLDSSIVLAAPVADSADRDNGLLQVWEIYENLRLEADLVTLSGCETALGTAYAGEGLIGLTRAFQYAGASSVLASLWSVNDRSTSELMTLFYSHLADGMPMDIALQQAQVTLIRGERNRSWFESIRDWFSDEEPPLAHPYHWAGFVLSGQGG